MEKASDGEVNLEMCDACTTYWRVAIHGQWSTRVGEDFDIEWFDRLDDSQGNAILFGHAG